MTIDWSEKYRPNSLSSVVGNSKAIAELEKWARKWETGKPKKKAVVLIGEPGVGKTSSVLALARDLGWGVVELNASDKRNALVIKKIAGLGATSETFASTGSFLSTREGGRKLIILDEADNLSGKEDYGGIGAIVETVRETKQPIALIVNDYYELTRRSTVIKNLCQTIKFSRLEPTLIKTVLKNICQNEGIKASDELLETIAKHSMGDLRAAINDLQSIAQGKKEITGEIILGERDTKTMIFDSLLNIFKTTQLKKSRESLLNLDENPEHMVLWIDENIPLEYKDPQDLANGYNSLSRADIFLGRIKKRQQYSLWSYANDMMSAGVSLAKKKKYGGFTRYRFPLWLIKMARSKSMRSTRDSLAKKISEYCHTSSKVVLNDILPYFIFLFNHHRDFRVQSTSILNLSDEEIGYLLGKKGDSHLVRRVLEEVKRFREKKREIVVEEFGEKEEKQKDLYDF